jgi:small-conductance mechanosensitive channel
MYFKLRLLSPGNTAVTKSNKMLLRYFKVFRKTILIVVVIIALIVISTVTTGKTAKITAVIAGIGMIYAGISFVFWLIKTPVKKNKDAGQ